MFSCRRAIGRPNAYPSRPSDAGVQSRRLQPDGRTAVSRLRVEQSLGEVREQDNE
ncbi:hypothetical protein HTIA_0581 [Halorhabdus tiamatea SARL4B]|uniref:Uncharacterized protein n=1 Tax=Halorhabdus tiamatea SARL4B TaxID=1033806 RepID=S6D1W2_9EURY|nr:hypothetical protein HTIA_0581 [Halorhabdus tiamatea SARL4B]